MTGALIAAMSLITDRNSISWFRMPYPSCGEPVTRSVYLGRRNGLRQEKMVRPERFELPTFWFVARRSIQLS